MKTILAVTLAGFLAAGCAAETGADQSAPDQSATTAAVKNIAQNKALVSQFFSHFSAGDIDDAFALVSDDASWWVPGDLPFSGIKTKTEYLQVVANIQQGFPDGLALNVTSMIGEGDKVAAEVQSSGEHANGRTYANKYHFLMTIEDGEITGVKEYMDTLHLFQLIQP